MLIDSVCSSTRHRHQIPQSPLVVGSDAVLTARVVRDLGIYLDSDLTMWTHVAKTVSSCFAMLRQHRSIRQSVSDPVLQSWPAVQLDRLQLVLNAAVRLIYRRQ